MNTTQSTPHASALSLSVPGADLALRLAAVTGVALLTAVAAQVSIPIPGTPVPMTLQTLAVVTGALALGPRLGVASMALYLLMGVVGLPVFAGAGEGFKVVYGATGGYLLGFLLVPAALAAGQRMPRPGSARTGWIGIALGVLLAHVVVFGLGVSWLRAVMGCGWPEAMALGLWPFLPGCALKGTLSILAGRPLARFRVRRGW